MPKTWELFSKEILGYIAKQTLITEEYVTAKKVQKWLDKGLTATEIAKVWNQGHKGQCSKGVNSKGVAFDSCEYALAIVKYVNQ
jgi:hypothetical protein